MNSCSLLNQNLFQFNERNRGIIFAKIVLFDFLKHNMSIDIEILKLVTV